MNQRVVPGDLAVINRGAHIGLLGRFVEVLYRVHPVVDDGQRVYCIDGCNFKSYPRAGWVWRVRTLGKPFTLITRSGKTCESTDWPCPDAWLAPLRDARGTDQMLLVAGPAPISTRVKRGG